MTWRINDAGARTHTHTHTHTHTRMHGQDWMKTAPTLERMLPSPQTVVNLLVVLVAVVAFLVYRFVLH